jgi:hypothetical protein
MVGRRPNYLNSPSTRSGAHTAVWGHFPRRPSRPSRVLNMSDSDDTLVLGDEAVAAVYRSMPPPNPEQPQLPARPRPALEPPSPPHPPTIAHNLEATSPPPAPPPRPPPPRLPPNARSKLRDLLQTLTAVGDFAGKAS